MMSEVLRETGRHVQLITAAKSFTRKDIGPAIRMMETSASSSPLSCLPCAREPAACLYLLSLPLNASSSFLVFLSPPLPLPLSVPVARAADSAVAGLGLIRLHPTDSLVVLGSPDAQFKKQLGFRSTIQLKKDLGFAAAEVAEVISDQEVR